MRRSISVFGGAALAILLSQFPEYAQQYTQRLGGAVDELRILTEEFDAAAASAGLSRDDALARYAVAGDTFLEGRGASMQRTFARYAELRATLERVQGARGWERAAMLPEFFDSEIGDRTLENFVPAVPVTLEGFAYAGAGFLFGYLLTSGIWAFLALPFRRRYPSGGRI